MNSVLLDIIVKGRGFHIPRYPQLILGDSKKYLQGDILDANAVVTEIDKSVTKLIDAAPDTLNTLKEIADSLHGDADIAGTLISRITDVENSVADLAGLQSTDISELTSRLGDVETKSTKNAQDIATIQTNKVDAISGKQLSTEDYTTAEKTKLAGIEAGALVNPTNVSAFTNDAGYLTEHQSLADYATQAWVNNQGFITEHQDISGKANIADLATVATSGSYNDLTNKPDFDSMLNNAGFVTQADFEDAVGIDTEGLQELKAILSDDDTTTGLLNVLDQKVEKVTGKLLSTEDYTTTEKTKLAGIEEGAQVNPTNVSELTNDAGYLVEDDLMEDVIDANGHEYVDLGLPSGTLWATMNVGATSETDYGLYFQWGDTQGYTTDQVGSDDGKKAFSWSDYKWTNDGGSTFTKYNATDGKTVLDLEDDAAAANWDGQWRMPTREQCLELFANTNKEWTTVNNVNGYKFTSKTDNYKYIFIPAAGICSDGSVNNVGSRGAVWNLYLHTSKVKLAQTLSFGSSGASNSGSYERCNGCPVRGVLSSSKSPKYASKQELDAVVSDVSELTGILGQSTNTYTPRAVEDGQTSLISNATNIQDALNKLDDALVELLAWKEYNAAPVAQNAFYRIGSVPGYASLVNFNGETIIVNDMQFILDVNANSWSTYSATDGELAGTLREEFGTQTYEAGGDTISGGRTEFEIDGETIVYNGGVFTPAISEWSAVGADELG